ncbi:MAG TPA: hypothetical protein VFD71_05665 [Planctomycetota bacterium]|nr:hypothetical protein [Planctomycetota bacterium]
MRHRADSILALCLAAGCTVARADDPPKAADAPSQRQRRPQEAEGPRYQINHVWGTDGHSDRHGGAILPDILRWIWRDYPK